MTQDERAREAANCLIEAIGPYRDNPWTCREEAVEAIKQTLLTFAKAEVEKEREALLAYLDFVIGIEDGSAKAALATVRGHIENGRHRASRPKGEEGA